MSKDCHNPLSFGEGRGEALKFGYETADVPNYELLKQFSKENKQKPTEAEELMWSKLRRDALGVHFRRQHIIGDYIADFVCLSHHLIIEIDGAYHNDKQQMDSDAERTKRLNIYGFSVLRFTNEEVKEDTERVLSTIKENLINYDRNKQC